MSLEFDDEVMYLHVSMHACVCLHFCGLAYVCVHACIFVSLSLCEIVCVCVCVM